MSYQYNTSSSNTSYYWIYPCMSKTIGYIMIMYANIDLKHHAHKKIFGKFQTYISSIYSEEKTHNKPSTMNVEHIFSRFQL